MTDKYERAAAYFKAHPDEIWDAWNAPRKHEHGCLFERFGDCACLTEIAGYGDPALDPQTTAEIRADKRVPRTGSKITPDNIDVFVEWNQRLRPDTASQRT